MVAICGVLILSLLLAAAWYFPRGDFLSVSEVCRRWGERPLDVAAFRSAEGDEFPRAAMACSLLKNQDDYVGMDREESMKLFGNPTRFYITEFVPAYLIEVAKTRAHDSWQILFRIDLDRKSNQSRRSQELLPLAQGGGGKQR